MQPTSQAAMSGGLAVTGRKPQGWCGPEAERREANYTARRFQPEATAEGSALTAWGRHAPKQKQQRQPARAGMIAMGLLGGGLVHPQVRSGPALAFVFHNGILGDFTTFSTFSLDSALTAIFGKVGVENVNSDFAISWGPHHSCCSEATLRFDQMRSSRARDQSPKGGDKRKRRLRFARARPARAAPDS